MSRCDSVVMHSSIAPQMTSHRMTEFECDPLPLKPPERLASGVILDSAVAYRDRLATRCTVGDFSDAPIDRAVIEACVCGPDIKRAIREAVEAAEQAF